MRMTPAVLLLWATTSAASGLEVKGIQLGSPESDVIAAMKSPHCSESKGARYCHDIGRPTFGGQPVEMLSAEIKEGGTATVLVSFKERSFSAVIAALQAKYGEPSSDKSSVVKNRMGASFDHREVSWVQGEQVLVARQRSGSIDKSSVMLVSLSNLERAKEERSERAERDAADL